MNHSNRSTLQRDVHAGDHHLGAAGAAVTLVEYGDYECPHCRKAHPIVRELLARFSERLHFVFRNFPLTQIHPHALHAAAAAESVASHGGDDAFWAMHDTIFAHQRAGSDALSDVQLARYAASNGVSQETVLADISSAVHEARIREDFMGGVYSGVNGTPTFFINGERFDGDWRDIEVFAEAIVHAEAAASQ